MTPDELLQVTYNLALACTLWATAIGIGLRTSVREMIGSISQVRLMTQGLLLNLLIIPVIVWLSTRVLPLEPSLAIGLVLLAASAGGPYGLVAAQLARGDAVFAIALISILQVSRVVTIPLWLGLVMPFGLADVLQVIAVLFLYILLPLAIGLTLHRMFPQRSSRWEQIARVIATLFLIILIVSAILLYRVQLLELLMSWTMVLFLGLQLASLALGYLFGRPTEEGKRTLAVTAVVRSSATALLVATQIYGGQPLVAATVIVYGVTTLLVSTLAAIVFTQRHLSLKSLARA